MRILREQKGFTLIELLIVIAIIAILASIAIPQYMKYQQKAKISSYAEPMARGCMMDAVAYCVEYPGGTLNVGNVSASLKNCSPISTGGGASDKIATPGGSVVLILGQQIECDSTGSLTSGRATGSLDGVDSYIAVCRVETGGFRCSVDSK